VVDSWADEAVVTPLFVAAQFGHAEVTRLLLNSGANIEVSNDDGATPLRMAAAGGHVGATKTLIEAGAVVDTATKDGRTPLFLASKNGHAGDADAVKSGTCTIGLLLGAGAEVNRAADDEGLGGVMTPLIYAAAEGHESVVLALLAAGASAQGQKAADFARKAGHHGVAAILAHATVAGNVPTLGGGTKTKRRMSFMLHS
jgi:ankyrin repeat protein